MFKANEQTIRFDFMHVFNMYAWLVCENMKLSVTLGGMYKSTLYLFVGAKTGEADSFPYIHSSKFISSMPTKNEAFELGRSIVHLSQRPDGTQSVQSDSIIRYFTDQISKEEFLSQLHDVMMDYIYCAGLSDFSDMRTVSENVGFLSVLYDAVRESVLAESPKRVAL